jgi:hypothetical protein
MAEYSNVAQQTVNPGEAIVFTNSPVPCDRGLVKHRDDTGAFLLVGYVPNRGGCPCRNRNQSANYLVDFGANIAIPTGGTVGEISVALAIDGTTLPASIMSVTPAAVNEFFNVSRAIHASVFRGCCQTVTIRNISDQPILVEDANVIISRPDLR